MIQLFLIFILIYTFILRKKIKENKIEYLYYREIPTDDTPAYVGKILKNHVDGNDIIATILDLSHKGYLKIVSEEINKKEKKVIYLQKNIKTVELEEHEFFLINQMFKGKERIIFDDYIKSKKFIQDFKTFDKMLNRRIERKSRYKLSVVKNVNKIIFMTSFLILGIILLYSLILPIPTLLGFGSEKTIIITLGISAIVHILIWFAYASYIDRSTNVQANISLKIVYILLSIISGVIIILYDFEKLVYLFVEECFIPVILFDFIISIITLLYIFNIIKHTEKEEFLYYIFVVFSIGSILLNFKLMMCLCIIFLTSYMFFKSPKNTNLKEEDFEYKWSAFKKYLEDFSELSEREENDIIIWEKYLIYAISLGINKRIVKKYSKLSKAILIDEQYIKRFYIEYLE